MHRTITVYGHNDTFLGEHYGVTGLQLPINGHLVIDAHPFNTPAQTVCYAAGHWLMFYDVTMPIPDQQPQPQPQPQPAPVVVPGPEVLPDPLLSLPRAPFNAEVHAAMQIMCACAEIRCPVILNPASGKERAWWRLTHKPKSPGLVEPVAMEQCIHDRGHDTDDLPHEWILGGWPYGPARHHPSCPRHPAAYNRPEGEGHPHHADGLTPDVWQQHGPDWCPKGAHAADTAVIVAEPTAQISARASVIRGDTSDEQRDAANAAYEADDGPSLGVRPYVTQALTELRYNQNARQAWGVCGAYGPDQGDEQIWCLMLPHGPEHAHQHKRPGGDRISW